MKFKKIISAFLSFYLLAAAFDVSAFADDQTVYHVDSLNGTRWADYICVYKGIERTGQNEWGENVVVNSEGVVTEKIPGADIRGKNLAVPEGGMVVSGTGDIGKKMYASAEIGDKCLFDEYSMRVYFSKGEIDPFYEKTLRVTGYNDVRAADTVIIYNEAGKSTGTNVFGFEVCVGANGYIVSAGGNNNTVPEGGYVISAIAANDTDMLKMYFTVGAKCELKNNSVTAAYGREQLVKTAEGELELLKAKLETAKTQYKLIDYEAIEEKISEIKLDNINTLEERNAVIAKMREIDPLLVESRSVDTRSVWYTAEEKNAEDIKKTVAAMKEAGINELVLASISSRGTIVPIDTNEIPFKCDNIVRRLDIIRTYVEECHANGISIVVLVPVMGGSFGENNSAWFDVTNTGEERDEIFFSPANTEYRKAFMDYVRYIITHYDIDGLQLDYIRYPQFYNGTDAGYDEATIKLFEEKTGLGENVVREIGKQLTAHPQWNTWWNFKTELINSWVEEIYGIASELRPDIYVTAAVAASNSVGNYCQDPAAWIKGGYIDGVYVMSYAEEINETTTASHIAERGDKSYLVMGCGAYLSISNQSLIAQTDNSIVLGADGTGYFEWGAVKNHRYTDVFKSSLFRTEAIPFTADPEEVADRLVATAKSRVQLYCASADEAKAAELNEIISALPDKNADKDALSNAVARLSAALDGDAKQYLTADLNSAIRAINMKKADYEFVEPPKNDVSSSESDVSANSEPVSEQISNDSEGNQEKSDFPTLPVAVAAVLVIALIAVVIFVAIKNKK